MKALITLKAGGNVSKTKARIEVFIHSFIQGRLSEKFKVWKEWKGYIFSTTASSSRQLMDGWVDRDKRTGGMDDTA